MCIANEEIGVEKKMVLGGDVMGCPQGRRPLKVKIGSRDRICYGTSLQNPPAWKERARLNAVRYEAFSPPYLPMNTPSLVSGVYVDIGIYIIASGIYSIKYPAKGQWIKAKMHGF
ncbi:hypothetical protein NPIL_358621 [Nephila pilipes]|uniref:Uncharacterized protein n=1 Tax=Nephila pilipes TaxID=299642 RepID=A0A8X6TY91_NEPPI|nr:hypothetical protein NPIL_358621 [Nephila pilipes]